MLSNSYRKFIAVPSSFIELCYSGHEDESEEAGSAFYNRIKLIKFFAYELEEIGVMKNSCERSVIFVNEKND